MAVDLLIRRLARCVQELLQRPDHGLEVLSDGTFYLPFSTSLRMGRLGYQSDAQSELHISYNSWKSTQLPCAQA